MSTPIQVVILGAGFGGFYTAYHLQRLARRGENLHITLISRENYFTMTPLLRFTLIEAGPKILPEIDRDVADYAVERLQSRGVEVLPSSPVQRNEPQRVHLRDQGLLGLQTF